MVWTRNADAVGSVSGLDLRPGQLLETKVEGLGVLLRILSLEPQTAAGRVGKGLLIAVASEDQAKRLLGSTVPIHLCKGKAAELHCSRFRSLKGLHIDEVRVLSHAAAVTTSWMKKLASVIRADEAKLATGDSVSKIDRQSESNFSFDDLVSVSVMPKEPKQVTPAKSAKSVLFADSPSPASGLKLPGNPEEAYAMLLSKAEAIKYKHQLPVAPVAPIVQPPPPARDDRADLSVLIHSKAEQTPGSLAEKWLTAATFSTRKVRGQMLPCIMDFTDRLVAARTGSDPRVVRELQSLALAIDSLMEFKGWMSTPATARTMDVLVQRFKAIEFAGVMMHKLARKDLSKSKKAARRVQIWEQSMRYELLPLEFLSADTSEARAVARDYRLTSKTLGMGTSSLFSDDSNLDSNSADSSDDSDSEHAAPRKRTKSKKNKKRKKRKQKAPAAPVN